jgi:hypothetical protein
MQTTFADTILNVVVTGNLVRFDFGTVTPAPTKDGKQEMRATPTVNMVMPIDGFVRAFGVQEQLIKKLVADGVLKAVPPQAGTGDAGSLTPADKPTN